MQDCKGVSTPMDGKLESYDGVAKYEDKVYYQHVVGQLMYAMIGTRADICFAVGVLSRFSSNPSPEHLTAVKRVIRYIKPTINYGIIFGTKVDSSDKLLGYGDSDWAGDPGPQDPPQDICSRFSAVEHLGEVFCKRLSPSHPLKESIWRWDKQQERCCGYRN